MPHDQLHAKLQDFVAAFRQKAARTACFKGGQWAGSIDNHLRSLLARSMAFIEWSEKHIPSRRAEAVSLLNRLAPTEHPSPAALLNLRASEWSELLRYFNGCTHHDGESDAEEFSRRVADLEDFLLDHLEPHTFEDQDEIDRLIQEVENP